MLRGRAARKAAQTAAALLASASASCKGGGSPPFRLGCAAAALQAVQREEAGRRAAHAAAALAALAGVSAAHCEAEGEQHPEASSGWSLLSLHTRRRAFFRYEKRIRDHSPPDKCFEYFATAQVNGIRMMKPENLLCSLVAVFPPERSVAVRTGSLPGEPTSAPAHMASAAENSLFTRLFDLDNDGALSYFEYLLLTTFLGIPPADVEIAFQMFDVDDSGSIDLTEFRRVTRGLRERMAHASHLSNIPRTGSGLEAGAKGEDESGIVKAFFGPSGKGSLDLAKFARFLHALHDEVIRLEFVHYSGSDKGTITGKDFAHSLISGVAAAKVDTYLDRIDALPEALATRQLDFSHFRHFAELRKEVHKLKIALHFFHSTVGHLDKAAFARAAKKITGQELDPIIPELIFAIFDLDNNKDLSPGEVIEVLRRREGNTSYRFEGDVGQGTSLWACLVGCVSRGR